MSTKRYYAFNEGWRFCIAYVVLGLFSLLHVAFDKVKPGILIPVMDNGKVEPPAVDGAAKEVATASVSSA